MQDLEYEVGVNRLIPAAAGVANDKCGEFPSSGENELAFQRRWNRTFHRAMDELARNAGLRKLSWQNHRR